MKKSFFVGIGGSKHNGGWRCAYPPYAGGCWTVVVLSLPFMALDSGQSLAGMTTD